MSVNNPTKTKRGSLMGSADHPIGDPIDFELPTVYRMKPIINEAFQVPFQERYTGIVTTEINIDSTAPKRDVPATGKIAYEVRGECFFYSFTQADVLGGIHLCSGDLVSFLVVQKDQNDLAACRIRLENPAMLSKYRGIVCSMKETFGFIEREDIAKEIFFHFSEAEGNLELQLGDNVEFDIQIRNGREFACNIKRLPLGYVIFNDIHSTVYKGKIIRPSSPSSTVRQVNQPLLGCIRYKANNETEVDVPYDSRDQNGDYTLYIGDWVEFFLCTDRRNGLVKATLISLLDESFTLTEERREQGVIAALKDDYGYLCCVERSIPLFFLFSEVMDINRQLAVNDEVEFTVVQEQTTSPNNFSRVHAIRIKHLLPNSVQFETLIESNIEGVITLLSPEKPCHFRGRIDGGIISYDRGDNRDTIMFYITVDYEEVLKMGDPVVFDIYLTKQNKEFVALNVRSLVSEMKKLEIQAIDYLAATNIMCQKPMYGKGDEKFTLIETEKALKSENNAEFGNNTSSEHAKMKSIFSKITTESSDNIENDNNAQLQSKIEMANDIETDFETNLGNTNVAHQTSQKYHGFIAVIKENFGFIESVTHDEELFFHFSNYKGQPSWLELGQEVEFTISNKDNPLMPGNCRPAENIRTLPKGSISQPAVVNLLYTGIVVRPLRSINPDQQEYAGLIQIVDRFHGTVGSLHQFGITSLVNKRDLLQKGDMVTLKVDEVGHAAEVVAVRPKFRSTIYSIKNQFGFLNHQVEDGKKLFFHMSELQGNPNYLHVGDTVEFSIIKNRRSGKSSACNLVKLSPDRIMSRTRQNVDNPPSRFIVIRPPRGPQGDGFSPLARMARTPGVYID